MDGVASHEGVALKKPNLVLAPAAPTPLVWDNNHGIMGTGFHGPSGRHGIRTVPDCSTMARSTRIIIVTLG